MNDFSMNAGPIMESRTNSIVIEDMTNVVEERGVVPPSRNVKFFIKEIKDNSTNRDGTPRQWKFLGLELYIDEGIEIDGVVKYKNKVMWQNVCYYADPTKYDQEKPFFAKKQYLIGLKQLATALGLDLSGLTPEKIIEASANKYVRADITVQAETTIDPTTGQRVKTGAQVNEIKNFKEYVGDFA